MDSDKYLVLIKNKNSTKLEDKTEEVEYCCLAGKYYRIKFKRGKVYPYKLTNVKYLNNPHVIDTDKCFIFVRGKILTNVTKCYNFGSYYKFFFDQNRSEVYRLQDVVIYKSCLNEPNAKKCMDYLKALAALLVIKKDEVVEDEHGEENEEETVAIPSTFIKSQYDKIVKVREDSALCTYLMNASIRREEGEETLHFPFGFNISQKKATERAFRDSVSIIEGPPGTGKTQTILNIIANAILKEKSIAVVSNNNSAVKNVQEKLDKNGLGFICAFLGSKKNKQNFFDNQDETYPDLKAWAVEVDELHKLNEKVTEQQKKLDRLLKAQNQMALLKQKLSALLTEQSYFIDVYQKNGSPRFGRLTLFRLSPGKILKLIADLETTSERNRMNSVFTRMRLLFQYGLLDFKALNENIDRVVLYLQATYYALKISWTKRGIENLRTKLESFNFTELASECSNNSMRILKAKLYQRYGNNQSKRPVFEFNYIKDFSKFISEYPVMLSTTYSLRNCIQESYLFDYVIIDESSQVDIVTGALALSCAKNTVIVGDTKQLPQIVTNDIREQCEQIHADSGLSEAYNYVGQSFLSSVQKLFGEAILRTTLREHYRCHPKIIGFCNQKYYDNQLIVLTEEKPDDHVFEIYYTAPGHHERSSYNKGRYNARQIEVITQEVLDKQSLSSADSSIGIVTPYRLQADKIKECLGSESTISSDTVHKYQGREKDTMIMTTVVDRLNRFIDDPNLINVAVSRAISKFIVVTSEKSFTEHGTNIGDLLRYMKYNARDNDIVHSRIISAFDMLYSEYSEELKVILKKLRRVSEYQSENLMNYVIEKVLGRPEFKCFKHGIHIPLRYIIKDMDHLTDKERRYASNIWTHVDFLIYNRLDKRPVLAVEVDGYSYHENLQRQKKDKMKDHILASYEVPILRIRTNESGEEERLIKQLNRFIDPKQVVA